MHLSNVSSFLLLIGGAYSYVGDLGVLLNIQRTADTYVGLEDTFFSSLENYQVGAKQVPESQHPWIARVTHSRFGQAPHVCTAVCLEDRIFVTAYRCVYSLKVLYTTITYKEQLLQTAAFVLPSNGSKQAFDDVAFIVVDDVDVTWSTIKVFSGERTDAGFRWFADYVEQEGNEPHKVVGYATTKGIHRIKAADMIFNLTELDVTIGIDMCSTILTFNHHMKDGFYVPCYHSCDLEQFQNRDDKCKNYHGVEGGAVVNQITNELIGVVTWGAYFNKYTLPVGFSVPNSRNYFIDLECAKSIRDDDALTVHNLCN